MDSENKKNEEKEALSFEEQLAELIKQSGGTVPPKVYPNEDEPVIMNNPHDEDEPIIVNSPFGEDEPIIIAADPQSAPFDERDDSFDAQSDPLFDGDGENDEPIGVYGGPQTADKTPEQIEAELNAIINGFDDNAADFSEDGDAGYMSFGEPDFSVGTDDDSLNKMKEEIAELEKDINETEIAELHAEIEKQQRRAQNEREQAAESYRLDYELEQMLSSMQDGQQAQPESEKANIDEAALEAKLAELLQKKAEEEAENTAAMEAKLNELLKKKAEEEAESAAAMEAKLDELLKEGREKDAKIEELLNAEKAKKEEQTQLEMQQMLDKIASLETMLAQKTEKPQENADVISDENIEIVPTPQARGQSSADAEKVAAMEAKLDELLNAKKEPTPDPAAVTEMEQMRAKIASLEYMLAQKPKESAPQQAAATAGMPTGDISAMFKQWFDLEMAAKMKTLILPEDKKKEEGAAQSYENDSSQGSDFIKLSDNIYYNVKEKKTYVMKELSPRPELPPVKKSAKPAVKRKPAAKKKALSRKRKRPATRNRALRPRRPRARRPKK